ncbi:uncharacterized protein LOC111026569 [Myzus persicae]|uniref:uncharacterized protein LOC111026569 n=1 Tax=Myzus persicae TaxID=13164 RepID=UPI000B9378E4|nr:uncharacterized protein LOC111026569 [Myzus persicae]
MPKVVSSINYKVAAYLKEFPNETFQSDGKVLYLHNNTAELLKLKTNGNSILDLDVARCECMLNCFYCTKIITVLQASGFMSYIIKFLEMKYHLFILLIPTTEVKESNYASTKTNFTGEIKQNNII